MQGKIEKALSQFLRNYDKPFTTNEISIILKTYGEKASKEEIVEFLNTDERGFPLEGNFYMTHAAVFNGMFFSFVPTAKELEQRLFVPGDRCIPFTDSEKISSFLKFVYDGKVLPKKVMTTDNITARNLFTLFGDEYVSQYIAADPVNKNSDIAGNNYELPPKVCLTGVSLDRIFGDVELRRGDRIL